jgi:hypothetical protein
VFGDGFVFQGSGGLEKMIGNGVWKWSGGAADLCEQGKGVFRPPLFSLNFFTGAVIGCPGREEKEVWVLGFLWFRVFCGFSLFCKIVPSSLWVLKAIIYRQNVAWASKFGPSTFFFVNFDFSYFFFFFWKRAISTSTQWGKSMIKNNALKVERVPNIFENLNSFETMLKMLKTMQMY